jgi:hypothetical protein
MFLNPKTIENHWFLYGFIDSVADRKARIQEQVIKHIKMTSKTDRKPLVSCVKLRNQ